MAFAEASVLVVVGMEEFRPERNLGIYARAVGNVNIQERKKINFDGLFCNCIEVCVVLYSLR